MSGPSPRKKKCRTCGKACGFNRQTQEYFDYCSVHKDTSCDFSEMECDLAGCSHPKGSHNDKAHKLFGRGQKTYQSRPPRPRDGKGSSRDSSRSSPKRGRSPPVGLQKNRSLASLYDRTGVCTIRTLIKNDQNDLRTGTRAEFRPFSEALLTSSHTSRPTIFCRSSPLQSAKANMGGIASSEFWP